MTLRPGLGATYRVQLGPDRSFDATARAVPYLARLGVETLYCSPVAEAVPGSVHGYDGTDPTRLRDELGGREGFGRMVAACEAEGLGLCVDIVPNHLATWPGGPWWRRLLAEGPDSELAPVFDVAWDSGVPGTVTLPLLSEPLDAALADGTVRLGERDGQPVVEVGAVDLPVAGGRPRPGEPVADVLGAQHYRLVDWHDVADRNYRRFFDIDGLVGVRVETPAVFDRTHALVGDLARRGWLSAVRVDHVDGLREPTAYLRRLTDLTGVPVVVEKILSADETLHPDWPVLGTTGYETLDDIGGALVDPDGLDALVAQARAEGEQPVDEVTEAARRLVADDRFPGELERSGGLLGVPPGHLSATAAHLTRYRTYLDDERPRPADAAEWQQAARRAGHPEVAAAVLTPGRRAAALGTQQLTGAIMAKGVEDTAWYRLAGPLVFCEVGGDPGRDRHDGVAHLHARAAARAAAGHGGLLPGTTHDTKRSEDVRCRLAALSELAGPFAAGLAALRAQVGLPADGGRLAFETRVLAQLVLGMHPAGSDDGSAAGGAAGPAAVPLGDAATPGHDVLAARLAQALRKGAREAKVRSSWTAPDEAYEERLAELGRRALATDHLGPLVAEVARLGAVASLSSVVLRAALPGVPDCYQGDETWNLSLVDPDNRRPVDLAAMATALDDLGDLGGVSVAALRRAWPDGRIKLAVTAGCLRARGRAGDALDRRAGYLALAAEGRAAPNVVAFARRGGDGRWAVAVATRLAGRLDAPAGDLPAGPSYAATRLLMPAGVPSELTDALSGRTVTVTDGWADVAHVLAELPVALLVAP